VNDNDNDNRTGNQEDSGPLNWSADEMKGCLGCMAMLIALAATAVVISGLCVWWAS